MKLIEEIKNNDKITPEMLDFLIETIEISLTEERCKSYGFLKGMYILTNKYIDILENEGLI